MSTDPKKLVKTVLLTYFLAVMFLLSGYSCKDVTVLNVTFTLICEALVISSILALHQNYKKYHISMFMFLEVCGVIFAIFALLMCIINLL